MRAAVLSPGSFIPYLPAKNQGRKLPCAAGIEIHIPAKWIWSHTLFGKTLPSTLFRHHRACLCDRWAPHYHATRGAPLELLLSHPSHSPCPQAWESPLYCGGGFGHRICEKKVGRPHPPLEQPFPISLQGGRAIVPPLFRHCCRRPPTITVSAETALDPGRPDEGNDHSPAVTPAGLIWAVISTHLASWGASRAIAYGPNQSNAVSHHRRGARDRRFEVEQA